jgi:hypothetical protein
MRTLRAVLILALLLAPLPALADTVLIEADRDATLIEDPEGAAASGSGPVLFIGRNNLPENSRRRALVRFDVTAALPHDARVESVRLTLQVNPSNATPSLVHVHRVLSDWGEGGSVSFGGIGAASEPGDATWVHTFYDDAYWARPGGHFVARASAALEVGSHGAYTWESTRKLVSDVRQWLAAPHRNFGWILIGDETTRQNAKAVASREDGDPAVRPVLEVTYR